MKIGLSLVAAATVAVIMSTAASHAGALPGFTPRDVPRVDPLDNGTDQGTTPADKGTSDTPQPKPHPTHGDSDPDEQSRPADSPTYTPIANSGPKYDVTPTYSMSCKIFGSSEPGGNYVRFTNTSDFVMPTGTIIAVNMPDGTVMEYKTTLPTNPGGSWSIMFYDGIPEGFDCSFSLSVP